MMTSPTPPAHVVQTGGPLLRFLVAGAIGGLLMLFAERMRRR